MHHLTIRSSLAVTAVLCLIQLTEAAYPLTTDSNCHCYMTNASTPINSAYFSYHKFFDFRNLSQYINVTKPLATLEENAYSPPTSSYFLSPEWTSNWSIMSWNNTALLGLNDTTLNDATVTMTNSPNNIYIERNTDPGSSGKDTFLSMRTYRHPEGFQSSAEIESSSTAYQFLSIRMLARTKGSPGAVTAMFTYRPPAVPNNISDVQEADLEIRTKDPVTNVQYTNQPAWNLDGDIPQSTRNVTLPGQKKWTDWVYYRMDWTPGRSSWFVNGKLVSEISFQAPRDPAQIMFNSWSDGGSWSGEMGEGQEAVMQIKFLDMVFNNTEATGRPGLQPAGGKCRNVCSIDETTRLGTPVLLTGNTPGNGNIPAQQPQQPQQPNQPTGGGGGGCTSKKYDQCAGKNWNGCKSCASGSSCRFQNDYYSQCL
ncbi:glycoside hydrolase [Podospora australis]|uniref:Glycoside hydrolase n=1 Tax=Podospora australis TaxID=1536484 RepID=A0AAN6WTB8_9PEZI|nr:glycoside hydrolase [Podospora australis]